MRTFFGGSMTKTVNLPDAVYEDLVAVTEELAIMAKKPLSISMAVYLLTAIYRAHVSEPCARDAFQQKLANSQFMSPEEFEKACDNPPKTPAKSQKSRKRKKD